MSHENVQSLQYLIDVLGIKSRNVFRAIAYRTSNRDIKDFFNAKLNWCLSNKSDEND